MFKIQLSVLTLVSFLITSVIGPLPQAFADDFRLPVPGVMVRMSPQYDPPMLKGIKVHPDNPFRFDFILDKGERQLSNDAIKDESSKLIKYFLASLTIPEKDLWVNLSPYEKNRIIPQSFGLTEMGRDLLAEDYMLKQITASLIYPEDDTGKKFWKRIYAETAKRFGTTNVPVNTFNKVWIIPEKAIVYENPKAETAYVVESKFKVMLEQDYLSMLKHAAAPNAMGSIGANIVREIVIPELTREVNENKNFTQLRQIFNSLILATWYKKKIKDSILAQVYADKDKVAGVGYKNFSPEFIYQRYLQAFKKGVYNYIKEESDPITQEMIPRKYFSGGVDDTHLSDAAMSVIHKWPNSDSPQDLMDININFAPTQEAPTQEEGLNISLKNPGYQRIGFEFEGQIADQENPFIRNQKYPQDEWVPVSLKILKAIKDILPSGWSLHQSDSNGKNNFFEFTTHIHGANNTAQTWVEIEETINKLQQGPLKGGVTSIHVNYSNDKIPKGWSNRMKVDEVRFNRVVKVYEAMWRALAGKGWSRLGEGNLTNTDLYSSTQKDIGGTGHHTTIINLRDDRIEIKIFEGDINSPLGKEGRLIDTKRLKQKTGWGFNLLNFIADLHDAGPIAVLGLPVLAGHKPSQKQINRFLELFFNDDPQGRKYAGEVFNSLRDMSPGLSQKLRDHQDRDVKNYYSELGLARVYERHEKNDGYDEGIVDYFMNDPDALKGLAEDLVRAGHDDKVALGYFPIEMHDVLRNELTKARLTIGRLKPVKANPYFADKDIRFALTPSEMIALRTPASSQAWGSIFEEIRPNILPSAQLRKFVSYDRRYINTSGILDQINSLERNKIHYQEMYSLINEFRDITGNSDIIKKQMLNIIKPLIFDYKIYLENNLNPALDEELLRRNLENLEGNNDKFIFGIGNDPIKQVMAAAVRSPTTQKQPKLRKIFAFAKLAVLLALCFPWADRLDAPIVRVMPEIPKIVHQGSVQKNKNQKTDNSKVMHFHKNRFGDYFIHLGPEGIYVPHDGGEVMVYTLKTPGDIRPLSSLTPQEQDQINKVIERSIGHKGTKNGNEAMLSQDQRIFSLRNSFILGPKQDLTNGEYIPGPGRYEHGKLIFRNDEKALHNFRSIFENITIDQKTDQTVAQLKGLRPLVAYLAASTKLGNKKKYRFGEADGFYFEHVLKQIESISRDVNKRRALLKRIVNKFQNLSDENIKQILRLILADVSVNLEEFLYYHSEWSDDWKNVEFILTANTQEVFEVTRVSPEKVILRVDIIEFLNKPSLYVREFLKFSQNIDSQWDAEYSRIASQENTSLLIKQYPEIVKETILVLYVMEHGIDWLYNNQKSRKYKESELHKFESGGLNLKYVKLFRQLSNMKFPKPNSAEGKVEYLPDMDQRIVSILTFIAKNSQQLQLLEHLDTETVKQIGQLYKTLGANAWRNMSVKPQSRVQRVPASSLKSNLSLIPIEQNNKENPIQTPSIIEKGEILNDNNGKISWTTLGKRIGIAAIMGAVIWAIGAGGLFKKLIQVKPTENQTENQSTVPVDVYTPATTPRKGTISPQPEWRPALDVNMPSQARIRANGDMVAADALSPNLSKRLVVISGIKNLPENAVFSTRYYRVLYPGGIFKSPVLPHNVKTNFSLDHQVVLQTYMPSLPAGSTISLPLPLNWGIDDIQGVKIDAEGILLEPIKSGVYTYTISPAKTDFDVTGVEQGSLNEEFKVLENDPLFVGFKKDIKDANGNFTKVRTAVNKVLGEYMFYNTDYVTQIGPVFMKMLAGIIRNDGYMNSQCNIGSLLSFILYNYAGYDVIYTEGWVMGDSGVVQGNVGHAIVLVKVKGNWVGFDSTENMGRNILGKILDEKQLQKIFDGRIFTFGKEGNNKRLIKPSDKKNPHLTNTNPQVVEIDSSTYIFYFKNMSPETMINMGHNKRIYFFNNGSMPLVVDDKIPKSAVSKAGETYQHARPANREELRRYQNEINKAIKYLNAPKRSNRAGNYRNKNPLGSRAMIVNSNLSEKFKKNNALLGTRGGIDLTPANMNLQTKIDSSRAIASGRIDRHSQLFVGQSDFRGNNDGGIQFHISPAMLAQLQNAPGFVPVIINIKPLDNLREFLGIASSLRSSQ